MNAEESKTRFDLVSFQTTMSVGRQMSVGAWHFFLTEKQFLFLRLIFDLQMLRARTDRIDVIIFFYLFLYVSIWAFGLLQFSRFKL